MEKQPKKKFEISRVAGFLLVPVARASDCFGEANRTVNNTVTLKGFECIFQSILRILVQLGGITAFVFLIIGGYRYLTAGGDPKKAQAAQNTLTYAAAGLVLLILAWFIFKFIAEFTGVSGILNFRIGN